MASSLNFKLFQPLCNLYIALQPLLIMFFTRVSCLAIFGKVLMLDGLYAVKKFFRRFPKEKNKYCHDKVRLLIVRRVEKSKKHLLKRPPVVEISTLRKDQLRNCSICGEEYVHNQEAIVLECKHVFHSSCITRSIKSAQKQLCPVCQRTVAHLPVRVIVMDTDNLVIKVLKFSIRKFKDFKTRFRFEDQKLPIKKSNLRIDQLEDNCSICGEGYEEKRVISVLPCCHIFHHSCILQWIVERNKPCPICRQIVGKNLLVPEIIKGDGFVVKAFKFLRRKKIGCWKVKPGSSRWSFGF